MGVSLQSLWGDADFTSQWEVDKAGAGERGEGAPKGSGNRAAVLVSILAAQAVQAIIRRSPSITIIREV